MRNRSEEAANDFANPANVMTGRVKNITIPGVEIHDKRRGIKSSSLSLSKVQRYV